jgi:hypothetical protein
MNQSTNFISEENVNLSGLDNGGYFAGAPNWVTQRLTGSIGSAHVIRLTVLRLGASPGKFSPVGK